ncbi:hypothetical protein [Yersinia enterocolitica]|uniref:hypothetical protein n=1 Tax=Yersinia enterocolitica TaxID=630 RepID=UPI003D78C0DA
MKLLFLVEKSNLYQRVRLIEPLFFGMITILIGRNLSLNFTVTPLKNTPKAGETRDLHEFEIPISSGVISLAKNDPSNPSMMQLMNDE